MADPDRIELRGLQLLAYCGVLPEEQARRQPFSFDIDLHLDLSSAGSTDDLTQTVDYGAVVDRIADLVAAERFNLLERMATRVAESALENANVDEVIVGVRKLRPPVAHQIDTTGVRIRRGR